MSFFILSEPGYGTSNWHRNILDGLMVEKQQKRFSLVSLNSIEELQNFPTDDMDAIFLVGNDSEWINYVTAICEAVFDNRVIVLGNHDCRLNNRKYSIVSSDIFSEVKTLYAYLKYYGKNRIAMYGINPESTSDSFKKASFLSCGASEDDLFYNTSYLEQCFEHFAARSDSYDGVICTNDFAAISLIKHLKNRDRLFITSCGGKMLANFFSPSITHTQSDYGSFGRAGIDLCRLLQKNSKINSVNIYLDSNFIPGETTDFLPLANKSDYEADCVCKSSDFFYADSEINEMMKVEALLNSCSESDLQILEHVIRNETYSSIAEKFFLSVNGLQYKLKNMFDLCGVKSKGEFISMLKKYKDV